MINDIKQSNAIQLNNQQYIFDVKLINDESSLTIPAGIIDELLITDSLYSIFPSGKLTINSSGNQIDAYVQEGHNELNERTSAASYAFNIDSHDRVEVYIKPVDTHTNIDSETFAEDRWALQYTFAIYDEEEIIGSGISKQKMFYLRDMREQILTESNIQWSTSDVVQRQNINRINTGQVGNNLRGAYTGHAIKDILNTVLPDRYAKFNDDWDQGITKKFHTSGPQSSSMDDLETLLDAHVSSDNNDNCILTTERDGEFSLLPLSFYFANAYSKSQQKIGGLVIDIFNVNVGGATTDSNKFTPPPYGIPEKDLHNFSDLTNFTYLNIANKDSLSELVTKIVHGYNFSDKNFTIDCTAGHIMNVKQRAQNIYANKLSGNSPSALLPINLHKMSNTYVDHVFSKGNNSINKLPAGGNDTLFKTLAFSPCISLDVNGSTFRQACRFIVMALTGADRDAPFTKFFSGEWLTTKIHHVFLPNKNSYYNNITCIKPSAGDAVGDQDVADRYKKLYSSILTNS